MALTAGDRVDLKKRIAKTLGKQNASDVDLTLNEFGFNTFSDWEGDLEGYVAAVLRYADDDEAMAQVDAYLHPTETPEALPQPEAFDDPANPWSGQGLRLFVSHIHQNATEAGALRAELGKRSVDAFVAHDSINPTEDWLKVVEYALQSCDACVALLAPGFRDSNWTDQEVGFCMARKLLIIPIEYGLTPYGFLGQYQALPVAKRNQAQLSLAIFELLAQKEQSREAMAGALVARWAASTSFGAARENYAFLKKIPREAWTQPLVDQALAACEDNGELRGAWIDDWDSSKAAVEGLIG